MRIGIVSVNPTTKLNLLFWDRIGIVADVSRRVADQQMNIGLPAGGHLNSR
jgi:hypothetical protein